MKRIFIFLLVMSISQFLIHSQYPGMDEMGVPRSFDDARVIRITYVGGEAFVKRSYEEGFEEAMMNLPVFDRDLVGTTYGRLELYLGRFNQLRLDYDTEIEFEQVPGLGKTGMIIRINRGAVYCFIQNMDGHRDIEIQTPDCGVFILNNGKYQIRVHENGGSEILVHSGLAEVNGTQEGIDVGSRYQVDFLEGYLNQRPFPIMDSMRDDFLVWNIARNRLLNRYFGYSSRYLDPQYAYYEYELNAAGRWMFHRATNGNIWIPNRLDRSWKPYLQGRWIHHPVYGMVWISYDPWGWYTHHYGRWQWDPYLGWYWVPGKHWAPAWVAWSWTDRYYGWCPLSIWNKPVIVINNQWVQNYRYQSGFPYNSISLIMVERENLWSPLIQKNMISGDRISKMRSSRLRFRGSPPPVKPVLRFVPVMNAKGKTVKYKKSGFVSIQKYSTEKMASGDRPGNEKISVYRSPEYRPDQKFLQQANRYSGPGKDMKKDRGRISDQETRKSKQRYQPVSKKERFGGRKDLPEKKETDQRTGPPMKDIDRKDAYRSRTQEPIRKETQDQEKISEKPKRKTEKETFQKKETTKVPTMREDKSIQSSPDPRGQKQIQKGPGKTEEMKDAKQKMVKKEKPKSEAALTGQKQTQKESKKADKSKDEKKKKEKKEKSKSKSKKDKDKEKG